MPERLKGEVVKDMEQLVADYPYFAIGQALLAVAYQNADDERHEQQLRRTASIMPNRDKLRLFTLIAKHRFESMPETPALPDEMEPKDNIFSSIESIETKEERSNGIIREIGLHLMEFFLLNDTKVFNTVLNASLEQLLELRPVIAFEHHNQRSVPSEGEIKVTGEIVHHLIALNIKSGL